MKIIFFEFVLTLTLITILFSPKVLARSLLAENEMTICQVSTSSGEIALEERVEAEQNENTEREVEPSILNNPYAIERASDWIKIFNPRTRDETNDLNRNPSDINDGTADFFEGDGQSHPDTRTGTSNGGSR